MISVDRPMISNRPQLEIVRNPDMFVGTAEVHVVD